MPEQEIGRVDHFFDKISVGMIILSGVLKVGDTIHVTRKPRPAVPVHIW